MLKIVSSKLKASHLLFYKKQTNFLFRDFSAQKKSNILIFTETGIKSIKKTNIISASFFYLYFVVTGFLFLLLF